MTITRCAVTKEEDQKKERTMGNKHIVPYGLYVAKGYVSPTPPPTSASPPPISPSSGKPSR